MVQDRITGIPCMAPGRALSAWMGVCEISPWGRFTLAWNESGLILLGLPDRAPGEHRGRLAARGLDVQCTTEVPESFRDALTAYCAGEPEALMSVPANPPGTVFQQRVWAAIRTIPLGETRSYAAIARQIEHPGAVRAVGNACNANLVAIVIPCHRVIAQGGRLGGFAAGVEWKRRLLEHELRIRARREQGR